MSRLWDKGAPLDERVLRYTAGEDHALDNRLVPYDVRASIAHAEMLHAQGLLLPADLDAIRRGLTEIGAEKNTTVVFPLPIDILGAFAQDRSRANGRVPNGPEPVETPLLDETMTDFAEERLGTQ